MAKHTLKILRCKHCKIFKLYLAVFRLERVNLNSINIIQGIDKDNNWWFMVELLTHDDRLTSLIPQYWNKKLRVNTPQVTCNNFFPDFVREINNSFEYVCNKHLDWLQIPAIENDFDENQKLLLKTNFIYDSGVGVIHLVRAQNFPKY